MTSEKETVAGKKVLLVAYHFPPLAGSSGVQRGLRFAQQLPRFGWQTLVLTASPRAYERCSDELMDQIPPDMPLRRAFALDAARQLALRGSYAGFTARPDRWVSWRFDALRQGLAMIREYRPDAIWSTYPIATAHLIGADLARRSGLPWIADFRDPMAQHGYPSDPKVWRAFKAIETRAMDQARFCTFTTPSAARSYAQRYPQAAARIALLENGYDEESFASLGPVEHRPLNPGALTLLHSGIVYPAERDPAQLIEALGRLAAQGHGPEQLKLRFRAAVHEDLLRQLAERHGVSRQVELLPPLPYAEALREMMRADALLILQAANCNEQVPAKLYEYLRAGRPIVALTDPQGDTGRLLQSAGVADQARLNDPAEIATLLHRLLQTPAALRLQPAAQAVQGASRLARSRQLADLLNRATGAALP